MPKTVFPEWLLARFVGRNRASSILGDLLEMSTTRGRFWYWTAYVRTLTSAGWRAPVAFSLAYVFSWWFAVRGFSMIHSLLLTFNKTGHYTPPRGIWHVAAPSPFWLVPFGDSLIALWFILPFVLARYGLRDRLTHLASVIVLLTMPFFSFYPVGVDIAAFGAAAMILTALCLPTWRRPMIVLAAAVVPIAVAIFFSAKVWYGFVVRGYGYASPQLQRAMALYRALELCIAAIVCSFLYRRLLQKKPSNLGIIT